MGGPSMQGINKFFSTVEPLALARPIVAFLFHERGKTVRWLFSQARSVGQARSHFSQGWRLSISEQALLSRMLLDEGYLSEPFKPQQEICTPPCKTLLGAGGR